MRLTKREGSLLIIVMILGLTFLVVNFVYFPLDEKIEKLEEDYELAKEEELAAKDLSVKTEFLEKDLEKIREESEVLFEGMVKVWDQSENLVYIEGLMDGLCDKYEISSYTPEDVGTIRTCDVGLKLLTNYDNLMRIIDKLEEGETYCTVESINMSVLNRDAEVMSWGLLDINVELIIRFYAKEQSYEYPAEYDFMDGPFSKEDIFR